MQGACQVAKSLFCLLNQILIGETSKLAGREGSQITKSGKCIHDILGHRRAGDLLELHVSVFEWKYAYKYLIHRNHKAKAAENSFVVY